MHKKGGNTFLGLCAPKAHMEFEWVKLSVGVLAATDNQCQSLSAYLFVSPHLFFNDYLTAKHSHERVWMSYENICTTIRMISSETVARFSCLYS